MGDGYSLSLWVHTHTRIWFISVIKVIIIIIFSLYLSSLTILHLYFLLVWIISFKPILQVLLYIQRIPRAAHGIDSKSGHDINFSFEQLKWLTPQDRVQLSRACVRAYCTGHLVEMIAWIMTERKCRSQYWIPIAIRLTRDSDCKALGESSQHSSTSGT